MRALPLTRTLSWTMAQEDLCVGKDIPLGTVHNQSVWAVPDWMTLEGYPPGGGSGRSSPRTKPWSSSTRRTMYMPWSSWNLARSSALM